MSLSQLADVAFAVVSGDLTAHEFLLDAEVLTREYVPHLKAVAGDGRNADILKIEFNMGVALAEIDKQHGYFIIRKQLDKRLCLTGAGRAECGSPLLILIDPDEVFILDKLKHFIVQIPDIAAEHERGAEHTPNGKLSFIVDIGAARGTDVALAVHADGEHIYIVEAAGR